MLTIDPASNETKTVHSYLLGSVAPRPIAFASTIDDHGNSNLAPFSFFNAFSANPPIVVFSPARRVRDNTTKHTLENAWNVDEVVINMVSHSIVHQMVLASTEYPRGVNEFEKAGFTPVSSEKVKPYRAKESPVQFECKVEEVKSLGTEGGAGNLIICRVLLMHINEDILDENQRIDPFKLDPVARLGGRWYTRASANLFEIANPAGNDNIGFDGLPDFIRNSTVLTGNDLARLARNTDFPSAGDVAALRKDAALMMFFEKYDQLIQHDPNEAEKRVHEHARKCLLHDKDTEAWKILFLDKEAWLRKG